MSYAELLEQAQDNEKHLTDAESDLESAIFALKRGGQPKLAMVIEVSLKRVYHAHDTEKDNIARLLPKAKAEADAELAGQNREYERSV
jgi:hypothetical protein